MKPEEIEILNASAGTGKTHRLIETLIEFLHPEKHDIDPERVVVTTFTEKAAAEVKERARKDLLEKGLTQKALHLQQAYIGTVHSIGRRLSREYAFEIGLPPDREILEEEEKRILFNRALEETLDQKVQDSEEFQKEMDELSVHLSIGEGKMKEGKDWTADVEAIVDKARANGMGVDSLEESKQKSLQQLEEFLGEVSADPEVFTEKLINEGERVLEKYEKGSDSAKNTKSAIQTLGFVLGRFRQGELPPWKDLDSLYQGAVGAGSNELFQEIHAIAGEYLEHPGFKEDLRSYIQKTFDTARNVLEQYERLKQEQGMADYPDLEADLAKVLKSDTVREDLGKRLKVLMVDEFQDSSPLQIDLFLKLSGLTDHALWVGDPKQCIYAFRNADPHLMEKVLEGTTEALPPLDENHRSREDLVNFVNKLFKNGFTSSLENRTLEVNATRKEKSSEAPLHIWSVQHPEKKSANKEERVQALAQKCKRVLEAPPHIRDKSENERALKASDIGVLCRTNNDKQTLSQAFQKAGISISSEASGLLSTAEGVLFRAGLSYLLDHRDSLAVMEISLLSQKKPDPGSLIDERLEAIDKDQAEKWRENDPFVQRIDEIRDSLKNAPVSTIASKLITLLDLPYYVAHWGDLHQRKANLERLVEMAEDYETRCRNLRSASTLGGFLQHLNRLKEDEEDLLGASKDEDAISILTYHQAKGLEWPMVVLFSLDSNLGQKDPKTYHSSLFFGIEDEGVENFQIEAPLQGRYLNFCPWPFGNKERLADGHPLKASYDRNGITDARWKNLLEEERRLLYVGMTRAREQLVIPWYQKKPQDSLNWIDQTLGDALSQKVKPLAEGGGSSELVLDDRSFPVKSELADVPLENDGSDIERAAEKHYPMPEGPGKYPPLYVAPSSLEEEDHGAVELEEELHPRLISGGSLDETTLGNAIHAVMALDPELFDEKDPQQRIQKTLKSFNASEISEKVFYDNLKDFETYIQKRWHIKTRYKEWPLAMMKEGQLYSGYADLILRTGEGLVLIDHKGFPGKKDEAMKRAGKHAGQLAVYKEMLEASMEESVIASYIYFATIGLFVKIGMK